MPVREFWEEEPKLLWAYRKSYMDNFKMEREKDNFNAWLQGVYIYEAVNKSIYNNFNKNNKIKPYMNQPIDLSKTQKDYEKEKQKELEDKIRKRNQEIKKMLGKK